MLSNPDTNETTTLDISQESGDSMTFSHSVDQLDDHLTLDVALTDIDDVGSERPFRIHLSGIEDTPPVIDMRLRGIGTAVTPNVLVPTVGKITDDYGLGKSWIEAVVNDGETKEFALQPILDWRNGAVDRFPDRNADDPTASHWSPEPSST